MCNGDWSRACSDWVSASHPASGWPTRCRKQAGWVLHHAAGEINGSTGTPLAPDSLRIAATTQRKAGTITHANGPSPSDKSLLAHPEFIGDCERSTAARANHRSTIPTGQRLVYFGCTFRAVKLGLRAVFVS